MDNFTQVFNSNGSLNDIISDLGGAKLRGKFVKS